MFCVSVPVERIYAMNGKEKKMDFHSTWKKKSVNEVHVSVSEEYRRGKAIRKEVKQTCLNVYQYLR